MQHNSPSLPAARGSSVSADETPPRFSGRLLARLVAWRSSWRLPLIVGLAIAVVASTLGLLLLQQRQAIIAEAGRDVDVLALAMTEQTLRALQAGHLVLEELQHTIAERQPATIEEFKSRLADEELFHFLKTRADFLPQVNAFTIIAADGQLVNFSRRWPIPPTDLSDRDYLAYFRDHDTNEAFISTPVRNRGTGSWTSFVVRRVNAPDGKFLGMVLAALKLEYFSDFFQAVTEKTDGVSVMLLRRDGSTLTGFPTATPVVDGTTPASPQWQEIIRSGQAGVFETEVAQTPGQRVVSVHPLTTP